MTVHSGDDDLTMGEFCDHLQQVAPGSVTYGGMVFTYGGSIQLVGVDPVLGHFEDWYPFDGVGKLTGSVQVEDRD
jgi:hypothetical protein